MTAAHTPEPPPPGTPTHRMIRLSRQNRTWLVLPWGEISVHKAAGEVRGTDDGWIARRYADDANGGPFRTRAAAGDWIIPNHPTI